MTSLEKASLESRPRLRAWNGKLLVGGQQCDGATPSHLEHDLSFLWHHAQLNVSQLLRPVKDGDRGALCAEREPDVEKPSKGADPGGRERGDRGSSGYESRCEIVATDEKSLT